MTRIEGGRPQRYPYESVPAGNYVDEKRNIPRTSSNDEESVSGVGTDVGANMSDQRGKGQQDAYGRRGVYQQRGKEDGKGENLDVTV